MKISKEQGKILKKAIELGIDDEELGKEKDEIFKEIESGELPDHRWFVVLDAVGTAKSKLTQEEQKKIGPLFLRSQHSLNESGAEKIGRGEVGHM